MRESFEIIGPGEGLVWYPISFARSDGLLADELFTAFSFKTKVHDFWLDLVFLFCSLIYR